ncbi:hypothetical protein TVAG_099820 [Trichomonas vaginalis G3]|uniref:Uncharacterized protein n=1 Tax=Trichomonas vaginalis (strain ATCC PRA-98 / G3) TaxID=412133 RepID=A2EK49_TRIV3|nr:hypothetical protein TVAGG3_0838190 [Trichomonas vaginalis G3]EAY06942.1 hypothetical protein TVAG_099820 [Trichomonas vaginalis G3]KAI5499093.1 hypothetical protein TVAGG3_0838190 [Trichomonas vaginalis G3]|eukprot:XP_001319165.1 hypothetical protein [Trichomonas vaginalis G3]
MKSFVSSMIRANKRMNDEINECLRIQTNNHRRFTTLKQTARSVCSIHPRAIKNYQMTHSHSLSFPDEPHLKHPKAKKVDEVKVENPFPFQDRLTYQNYMLPQQPNIGVKRAFNTVVTNRYINNDIKAFIDQTENPDESITPLYAPSIDPVLHVGKFHNEEINWDS